MRTRGPSIRATALGMALVWQGAAYANCSSEANALKAQIAQVNANANSLGMCNAARALADIYDRAAAFHRRCITNAAGQAQAAEYERASAQARSTAAAACN
jgi:hypothetical protein